jgi:hypothetical protein
MIDNDAETEGHFQTLKSAIESAVGKAAEEVQTTTTTRHTLAGIIMHTDVRTLDMIGAYVTNLLHEQTLARLREAEIKRKEAIRDKLNHAAGRA